MYRLLGVKKIDFADRPHFFNHIAYVHLRNSSVMRIDFRNLEEISSSFVSDNIVFTDTHNDLLILYTDGGYSVYDTLSLSELASHDNIPAISGKFSKDFMVIRNADKSKISKHNILTGEKLWEVDNHDMGYGGLISGNKLVYNQHARFNHNIYCHDCDDGSMLWQMNIDESFPGLRDKHHEKRLSFKHIYNASDDTAIVQMSNGWLLGVRLTDGEIVWKLEGYSSGRKYGGKLHDLNPVNYAIINIDTGDIEFEVDMQPEYRKYEVRASVRCYTVREEYIYFIDIATPKICVMEKSSGKILWTYRLPPIYVDKSSKPIIVDDRLYVKNDEEIHIFEKE